MANHTIWDDYKTGKTMAIEHRNLSQMLEVAIVAARLAGQRAMEEIGYTKTSIKNKNELVTQTDARCQQIIIDRIKETYPDHGFIAEEGNEGNVFKQPPRGTEPAWWLIDPIDGTNNFAHQMLTFTISIAAMYQGEPVVAVIFEPATESMFTAVREGEAQLNGRHITVGEDTMNEFTSIGLDSHIAEATSGLPSRIIEAMLKTRFRCLGSTALQLAYVAKGSLIATIHPQPKFWDIAAGTLIVEAAGGIVTDWQGRKIFPADLDNYEAGRVQIMAANKKVHPELLELMKS